MKLTRDSAVQDVALAVGASLNRYGIGAVLTGGACASIHSGGAYSSLDLDFVLTSPVTLETLVEAMAAVGFEVDNDRFVHPDVEF